MSDGRAQAPDLSVQGAQYLEALRCGDRREAIRIALETLDSGVPAEIVLSHLVAHSQVQVGVGWQEDRWTVAMEHRASGIAESVLSAVTDAALLAPGAVIEGSRGPAVVSCTEGEWHVFPGRLASETLRLRGADVTFIGPSVPAEDLAGFLGTEAPTAVAISCSMQLSLAGAWRSISALRAIGMTVICGGRGFGPQGVWGLALGADLWAPDFQSGAEMLLTALAQPAPQKRAPVGSPEVISQLRIVGRDFESIVEAATTDALQRWPYLSSNDAWVRSTRGDFGATLRAIQSAVVVGSDAVLTEFIAWFEAVLTARNLPLSFVPTAFQLLIPAMAESLDLMRSAAQRGLQACTADPMQAGVRP